MSFDVLFLLTFSISILSALLLYSFATLIQAKVGAQTQESVVKIKVPWGDLEVDGAAAALTVLGLIASIVPAMALLSYHYNYLKHSTIMLHAAFTPRVAAQVLTDNANSSDVHFRVFKSDEEQDFTVLPPSGFALVNVDVRYDDVHDKVIARVNLDPQEVSMSGDSAYFKSPFAFAQDSVLATTSIAASASTPPPLAAPLAAKPDPSQQQKDAPGGF